MSIVNAKQLIFTRVEPAYSPKGKSGFQTAYKSKTLPDTIVSEIEDRVQCYRPRQPVTRLQFFQLKSGDIVLTHTTQIASHIEITDKDGRKGAFIAHCLILSQSDFMKFGYYPFAIFNQCDFLDDPEAMVHQFGQATGIAPTLEIPVRQSQYSASVIWSNSEVLKLVSLSLGASNLNSKGQSVLLFGESKHINAALETIFFLVPQSRRLACSFDTYTERCPTQRGLYWAMGATKNQGGSSYILVNATQRQVIGQVSDEISDRDLYLTWLKNIATQGRIDQALDKIPTIQNLASAFTENSPLHITKLNKDACYEFLSLNKKLVWQRMNSCIADMVGKSLAQSLTEYLIRIFENLDIRYVLKAAATQSLDSRYLTEIAIEWLILKKQTLSNKDGENLQNLARQANNMKLLYLASTFMKKVDGKSCKEALERMSPETFQSVLDLLLKPIAPADFVSATHLSILLSDGRLQSMSGDQFIDLIQAVVDINSESALGPLASYVAKLDNRNLHQIEKIIKKSSDISTTFRQAVSDQREKLGPKPGLFRFI